MNPLLGFVSGELGCACIGRPFKGEATTLSLSHIFFTLFKSPFAPTSPPSVFTSHLHLTFNLTRVASAAKGDVTPQPSYTAGRVFHLSCHPLSTRRLLTQSVVQSLLYLCLRTTYILLLSHPSKEGGKTALNDNRDLRLKIFTLFIRLRISR